LITAEATAVDADARPTRTADRLAPIEDTHFWFVGRDRLTRHLLDRFAGADPLLDLGCGTARFAGALATVADGQGGGERPRRAVFALDREPLPAGTDPPAALQGRVLAADVLRVPFADRSFGTVVARDVLEHVDVSLALGECHRLLRPGGVLIALVPAWPSLWSARDVAAGHLRRYRRNQLRAALERNGFRMVEVRGYQFFLLPLAFVSRLTSRVGAGNRDGDRDRRGRAMLAREETPRPVVNRVLGAINRFEADLARTPALRPPTGSTLAVVAVRR
jgi:SAM-dependent methyltransferase